MDRFCLICDVKISKTAKAFCSNKCQQLAARNKYIEQWLRGEVSGMRGSCDLSRHIRNYLLEKSNNKCQLCGWGKVNPKSGTIPLVIDHIDGNCLNNKLENLRVLCPNCDSLTPTYKSLNKKSGRRSQRKKYN